MNKLLHLVPCLLLTACGTAPVTERIVPVQESAVAGTALDLKDTENIRYSEQLKAYPVGRYADPNNPSVMHEAHTLYRSEQSPRWNLNPNVPTAVPMGPAIAVTEPSKETVTITTAELEEIRHQAQQMQATFEQNERLAKELQQMRDEYNWKLNSIPVPTSTGNLSNGGVPTIETNGSPISGTVAK